MIASPRRTATLTPSWHVLIAKADWKLFKQPMVAATLLVALDNSPGDFAELARFVALLVAMKDTLPTAATDDLTLVNTVFNPCANLQAHTTTAEAMTANANDDNRNCVLRAVFDTACWQSILDKTRAMFGSSNCVRTVDKSLQVV